MPPSHVAQAPMAPAHKELSKRIWNLRAQAERGLDVQQALADALGERDQIRKLLTDPSQTR